MQLKDILEENSIKAIRDKTKISEENLEYLLASEFEALSKVKTLGFISILEREYKADLTSLRDLALEYYGESREQHLFPMGQLIIDDHRSKSKALTIFIFLLLGFSSWYFFTQFDKKHLNELIPFMGEQRIESPMESEQETKEGSMGTDLSIDNVIGNVSETVSDIIENDIVTPVSETLEIQQVIQTDAVEDNVTDDNITQSMH